MAKREVVTVYKDSNRGIYYKYAGKVYGFDSETDCIPDRDLAYKIATGKHNFLYVHRTEHFNKHREEYTYITRFQFILPSKQVNKRN